MASLKHPSLALPGAFGWKGPSSEAYILRRFVDGAEIVAALRGTAPKHLFPWIAAAAEALGRLHRAGVLHRNLKPSNLIVPEETLLQRRGLSPRVVLCDPAWWPDAPETTAREGFAAPELAEGAQATPSSDLYALGAVFYTVLTGKALDPVSLKERMAPCMARAWAAAAQIGARFSDSERMAAATQTCTTFAAARVMAAGLMPD